LISTHTHIVKDTLHSSLLPHTHTHTDQGNTPRRPTELAKTLGGREREREIEGRRETERERKMSKGSPTNEKSKNAKVGSQDRKKKERKKEREKVTLLFLLHIFLSWL